MNIIMADRILKCSPNISSPNRQDSEYDEIAHVCYVAPHGKRDFMDVIKVTNQEDYPDGPNLIT